MTGDKTEKTGKRNPNIPRPGHSGNDQAASGEPFPKALFEYEPVFPGLLTSAESQAIRVPFTTDAIPAFSESELHALGSGAFDCSLLLPSGARAGFRLSATELPDLASRVRQSIARASRQPDHLRFWGLQARASELPEAQLWLDPVPALPAGRVAIAAKRSLDGAVPYARVSITGEPGTVRIITEPRGDTLHARHVMPFTSDPGGVIFDVVAVKLSSDHQAEFQVFHPPSLEASFWHYASSGLREGATILGSELLSRAAKAGPAATLHVLHMAGVYALRFGTEADARTFIDVTGQRATASSRHPAERAIAVLRTLLNHELTGKHSAEDEAILVRTLAGEPPDALPLASIELTRAAQVAEMIAAGEAATVLADAAGRYRQWARRLNPSASVPAYDTLSLAGPAALLPERPQDRQLALARAKKKSACLRLRLAS